MTEPNGLEIAISCMAEIESLDSHGRYGRLAREAIGHLRAAAPSPEPVAWMVTWPDGEISFTRRPTEYVACKLTALAPLSQFAENANWSARRVALRECVEIAEAQGWCGGGAAVCGDAIARKILALAALPSSPAPFTATQNQSEGLPKREPAGGTGEATQQCAECNCANPPTGCTWIKSGEAIFEECAEIAEAHVGSSNHCNDEFGYNEACRDIAEAIRVTASNRKTMDAIAKER